MTQPKQSAQSFRRIVTAILALVLLAGLTWVAAAAGWGSLMTAYAARTNQIAAADIAVRRSPTSANAHYIYATILEAQNLRRAVAEHREAVRARPQDYALWLSLARAEELNGNTSAAIAAAQRAVPLAPFYAQPHYQLGNILLRAGRTSEAFAELRLAAASDPTLMPGIIDLAWRLSKGDLQFVENALDPQTSEARLALARNFRAHKQVDAAIRMYASAGPDAKNERDEYAAELIRSNHVRDAAALWQIDHPNSALPGQLDNPGFENEIDLRQRAFGWHTGERTEGGSFALDTQNPAEGKTSLRIDFTGGAGLGPSIISQVISIEPNGRYELRFSARTDAIVSGGAPYISILEPDTQTTLSKSPNFPGTSDNWREYTLSFTTGPQAAAIQIALQREACDTSPCPIFGRLWLDNFSLRKW